MSASDDASEPLRIGVFACQCGTNIAGRVRVAEVVEYARSLPGVAAAREYRYMCSDPGQDLIRRDIRELGLNRVIVAACSPHVHEETFRAVVEEAGLNRYLFHTVNVREHVSWVTRDPDEATRKAKDLVRAAVQRAALHEPLEPRRFRVHPGVAVVGGGIAGIHAALTLANAAPGVRATLTVPAPDEAR